LSIGFQISNYREFEGNGAKAGLISADREQNRAGQSSRKRWNFESCFAGTNFAKALQFGERIKLKEA
jgi:hypothetical protein